jgi:hypothetical protein
MKPTHELSKEQHDELSSMSDEKTVVSFLSRLNTNYGGGEVLKYEHMFDIFTKKYYIEDDKWLTIYVDTVRMLRLISEGEFYVLSSINYLGLRRLHNALAKQIKIDEALAPIYVNEVSQHSELNQTISGGGFKTRFELIATIEELKEEGSSMEHCIASYANIIASGHYIAFRVFEEETNGRFTLGLYKNAEGFGLSFDQLKGTGNSPANVQTCLATVEFCTKNGIRVSPEMDYDLFPITGR